MELVIMANPWKIPKEVEELVLERDQVCVYCGCEFGNERAKNLGNTSLMT